MNKHLEEHFYNPEVYYDPKQPKFQCTIQASGQHFDPDSYLAQTEKLHNQKLIKDKLGLPGNVKEKLNTGELPYKEILDIFDMPFILLNLSNATKIKPQIQEATNFLQNHLDDLIKLAAMPSVEDFSINFLAEDYDPAEQENLPDEFLSLCNKIGILGIAMG